MVGIQEMKRREFLRWAGTLGVAAVTADALRAFGADDDEASCEEQAGERADDELAEPQYIPYEWYFATWQTPSLLGQAVECLECGAQARYYYSRHNRVDKEVHVYKCLFCGSTVEGHEFSRTGA